MLKVTERAKEHLRELLLANANNPDTGLRLTISRGGQLGVLLDREVPGDCILEQGGLKLLLLGPELLPLVEGATLDIEQEQSSARLVISKRG